MKISIIHRLVRYIATYHFISCFVVFLVVEVNGVSGRPDIKTKLLLQNIRTHLAQKVDEIVQQKECESGLTLCKNTKTKEESDDEKSEEIPPPPKIARGAHKPLIKVNPKDVIQTLMPKARKSFVRKLQKEGDGEKHKKFFQLSEESKSEEEKPNKKTSGHHKPFTISAKMSTEQPGPIKISSKKEDDKAQKKVKIEEKLNIPSKSDKPTKEMEMKKTEKERKVEKVASAKPKTGKKEPVKTKAEKEEPVKAKSEKEEPKKTKPEREQKELKKGTETKKRVKEEVEKVKKEKGKEKIRPKDEKVKEEGSLVLFGEAFIFVLDSDEVENELCRKHSQIYQKQLKKNKIWALMMYDASAKLPSGILQGNVNQFGDFDECLAINAVFKNIKTKSKEVPGIKGKYCLANIDLSTDSESTAIRQVVERAESFQFIKSTIYDPGHFIPRFSSINWGLCVPSACPAEDVEKFIKSRLEFFNGTSGVFFDVKVENENCVVKDDLKFESHSGMLATVIFYLVVIGTSLYATYCDKQKEKTEREVKIEEKFEEGTKDSSASEVQHSFLGKGKSILMAFSLKKNLSKLLSSNDSKDSIDCINGIKSIFTIMLYFAHKIIQLGMTPYTNRILLTKISNEAATVPLRASIIYTDSFLLISGVLTSYNLTKEISARGRISWVKKSVARFIRLTPALFAVLLFYAYIWDHLGSGPTWNLVVKKNSELCQKYSWRNLLYIQNFFAFEDMCAPQTHQLALDMQLSMLSPLFVYLLHTYDKVGVGILQALFLLSSIMRYTSTSNNNLSVVIYHGMSVSQLYRTANLLYGQALHRASPYILGTIVGYYLKKLEKEFDMPKAFAALGWIIAFSMGFYSVVSPSHLAFRNYQYDVQEAAQYAALSPVAWALALSWLIAACHLGYGGKLNDFLCQKSLLVFSRISYSVYLTQFLVFFYRVGVKRFPEMFSFTGSFNVAELFVVIAISVVVTLLFDIPMMEVKRILLDKPPTSRKEEGEDRRELQEDIQEGEGRSELEDTHESEERSESEQIPQLDDYEIISPEEEVEIKGEEDIDEEIEEDEDTGEAGSEEEIDEEAEEGAEDLEEMTEEESEMQPLRRSHRFRFTDDPEEKEWFKVEPETKDNSENQ